MSVGGFVNLSEVGCFYFVSSLLATLNTRLLVIALYLMHRRENGSVFSYNSSQVNTFPAIFNYKLI